MSNIQTRLAVAKLNGEYFFPATVRVACPNNWNWGTCPGVGEPALDGIRCPICGFTMQRPFKNRRMSRHSSRLRDHTEDCACGGRHWTASMDAATWMAAIINEYLIWITEEHNSGGQVVKVTLAPKDWKSDYDWFWGRTNCSDIMGAFFQALERAVRSMGAEVEDA